MGRLITLVEGGIQGTLFSKEATKIKDGDVMEQLRKPQALAPTGS